MSVPSKPAIIVSRVSLRRRNLILRPSVQVRLALRIRVVRIYI